MTNDDIEKFGHETIQVPDRVKDSIGPLIDIIDANNKRSVTEAVVRLALVIGYQTGKAEPRSGEYGLLSRSTQPPTVRGPGWGT